MGLWLVARWLLRFERCLLLGSGLWLIPRWRLGPGGRLVGGLLVSGRRLLAGLRLLMAGWGLVVAGRPPWRWSREVGPG